MKEYEMQKWINIHDMTPKQLKVEFKDFSTIGQFELFTQNIICIPSKNYANKILVQVSIHCIQNERHGKGVKFILCGYKK